MALPCRGLPLCASCRGARPPDWPENRNPKSEKSPTSNQQRSKPKPGPKKSPIAEKKSPPPLLEAKREGRLRGPKHYSPKAIGKHKQHTRETKPTRQRSSILPDSCSIIEVICTRAREERVHHHPHLTPYLQFFTIDHHRPTLKRRPAGAMASIAYIYKSLASSTDAPSVRQQCTPR